MKIWVVEMAFKKSKGGGWSKWFTTIGVGLSHEDGLRELQLWAGRNCDSKVRLKKYSR